MAQLINFLQIRYITQEQRSFVLKNFVAAWFLSQWASSNNNLAKTLREVQQLAQSRAEAFVNWISEQVSARQC